MHCLASQNPGSCCPGELPSRASDCSSIGPPATGRASFGTATALRGSSHIASTVCHGKCRGFRIQSRSSIIARAHTHHRCDKRGHHTHVFCPQFCIILQGHKEHRETTMDKMETMNIKSHCTLAFEIQRPLAIGHCTLEMPNACRNCTPNDHGKA